MCNMFSQLVWITNAFLVRVYYYFSVPVDCFRLVDDKAEKVLGISIEEELQRIDRSEDSPVKTTRIVEEL